MRRTTRDRVSGVVALISIVVLVVGVPLLLVEVAGWPLPRTIPDWDHVRRAISQGDIPADTVVKTLAAVVWVMWLQVMWALVWEIAVNVPRLTAGRRPRPAPLIAAPVANGVGRLITLVLALGVAVASSPAPAIALPSSPARSYMPRTPASMEHPSSDQAVAPVAREGATGARWKVDRSDSLWKIAESALGDGERADEILEFNRWLGSPRHLKAGQVLTLPDGAAVPADRLPDPIMPAAEGAENPAAEPAGAITYLAPTHIVIETGDTLWGLSEERLSTVDDDVTPSETMAHVNEVIAENPDVIEDPNLIYPGEVFAFPAVGTPPPEPAKPVPGAAPETQPVDDAPAPAAPVEPEQGEAQSPTPDATVPPAATVPSTTTIPSTTTQAPAATLVPAATVESRADDGHAPSAVKWLTGVSGATALASGILLLYRRRLALRAARGAAAYRASTPDDPTVLTAVTRASDVSLLRWANRAIADVMSELHPGDIDGQPLAIELSETFGIEVLWTHANPDAPEPWQVTDDGWSWRLAYDPEATVSNLDIPAAIPALVTIGRRDENQLLLNLEAVGTLAVDGDDRAASEFIRSVVVELATGELLSDAFLVASGVELDGLATAERVQQRDRDGARDSLRAAVDASQTFLDQYSLRTAFEARLGGDGTGRESTIVVVDDEYAAPLDGHVAPGLGVCLVYTGARSDGACVIVAADGTAVLEPFGIEFDLVRLPLSTLESVSDLLDEASEPFTPPPPVEVHDDDPVAQADTATDLGDDDDWEFPEPAVLVRVLGAPEVIDASLGRIETSIVAYLACHGGKRRDEQVINAVWNGRAVEPKTLWNKISKIRSALGPDLVPARLPNSPNVILSDRVMTDLDVLSRLHARSNDVAESEALRLLLHGLDLIDGVPFDSAEYDWSFETQDHATACETIEAATLRCIDVAVDLGDLVAARHAVSQGLRALPMNEPLYRARMRIESASGNPDGVRQALSELTYALTGATGGQAVAEPEPETLRVAKSLAFHE